MLNHEYYMGLALELAREAGSDGEAPVGCVVVNGSGTVIGSGRNRRERSRAATAHAELEAIDGACRTLGDWRLSGCTLYVTLEPCPMCAGAVIMSRVDNLFYGARDETTGSCGSVCNLFMEPYGRAVRITGGILAEECSALLSGFFMELRGTGQTEQESGTGGQGLR